MRLRFSQIIPASLLVLSGAVPACGSLDTSIDSVPALATLTGQVVNPASMVVTSAVRVAVVWQAGFAGEFNVAQDLPVQPVFPASFTIQLDDPPPASALTDGAGLFGPSDVMPTAPTTANALGPNDAGLSSVPSGPTSPSGPKGQAAPALKLQGDPASSDALVAVGTVVAYLDRNGNGKLDLVADGATGYVDQILATNQTELLYYFEGSIPAGAADQLGHQPTLGYNLHSGCDVMLPVSESPGSLCATVVDPGPPAAACYEEWQSIETPVTLSIGTDPQVNSIMCQTPDESGSESVEANGPTLTGAPGGGYPDVCDPSLNCAPDGSSYSFSPCQTVSKGICEGTVTSCTNISYARPSPVPSDWPCKS